MRSWPPPEQRFEEGYIPITETGCWIWLGATNGIGYGKFYVVDRMMYAHRFAYIQKYGEIPEGLELDHLCRNSYCVNPDHLEAVTHQENVKRGKAGENIATKNREKTHCPQGHPYSGDNLYIKPNGSRVCRTCRRDYFERKRESKLMLGRIR